MEQKRNYGLAYFDNETRKTQFIPFLTRKEAYNYPKFLNLGKDCVSSISIVKMVECWNAYDGVIYSQGGKR